MMLGHASILQTQRYLNVTDEELRRGLEVSWNNKADHFDSRREPEMIGRCQEVSVVCASVTNRSPRGPRRLEIWLRGRDLKSL